MSLLGKQVFANPTTPIWGQGGGGGGNVIPVGGELTFLGSPTMALGLTGDKITALDASANYAPFQASEFRAFDGVGSYVSMGQTPSEFGIASFLDDGTPQNTFATFGSGGWELSNLTAINGVPYVAQPITRFDFSNHAGAPLSEAPDYTVLNAISFTPPVDGKLYMESLGTFISTVVGGGAQMTFSVNGTTQSNAITNFNAYNSNVNVIGSSMLQIDVSGGQVYDISSIGLCSALPPSGADMVMNTTRMFLMFSQE